MKKIYTSKEVGLLLNKSSQQIRRYTKNQNGAPSLLEKLDDGSANIHITREAIIDFLQTQLGEEFTRKEIEEELRKSEEKLESGLLSDTKTKDVKRKKEIYRFVPRISKGNAKKALKKIFGHRSHNETPREEVLELIPPSTIIPVNPKLKAIFLVAEDKYLFIKGLYSLFKADNPINKATVYFLQDRANALEIPAETFQGLIDDEIIPLENIRFEQRIQLRAFITEAIFIADLNLSQKEEIYSKLQIIAKNHMLEDKFEEYKIAAEKKLDEIDEY